MGHEYCGIVEEVGSAVKSIKPGQFVIGSFFASDNTCPHCHHGYQTSCQHKEFVGGAQAPLLRCRSLTGPWCRRPMSHRTTCFQAYWRLPTCWAPVGLPRMPPT